MIDPVQIATNRYAPDGAQAINMYRMDNGETLTLGQLFAAVCIGAGANMEAQAILKVNSMNANTELIKSASACLKRLAENQVPTTVWNKTRTWLIVALGIPAESLPESLADETSGSSASYAKRFQVINAMKVKMEALTRQSQEDMIDVQSMISKRDVAYTTGTSLIKSIGSSQNNTASLL